jgi:hypothetical protein
VEDENEKARSAQKQLDEVLFVCCLPSTIRYHTALLVHTHTHTHTHIYMHTPQVNEDIAEQEMEVAQANTR